MSKNVGKTVTVYLDDPDPSKDDIHTKLGYRWYFPKGVGELGIGALTWGRIGEYIDYLLSEDPGWNVRVHIEDVYDETQVQENIGIDFQKIDFFEEDGKYVFRPYPEIMD